MIESLPVELLLQILSFLEPHELTFLRGVSRHFHNICNDNDLWRNLCFSHSSSEASRTRTGVSAFQPLLPFQNHPRVQEFRRRTALALSAQQAWVGASLSATTEPAANGADGEKEPDQATWNPIELVDIEIRERARRLANWDPSYFSERVDWYAEYVARHGPISSSWFQPPIISNDGSHVEARGLALVSSDKVIAPLEDDSVAIWSLAHNENESAGQIIHKSQSGTLRTKDSGINPTISSAIAVDNEHGKAYIVVQNCLQEVDLQTLKVSTSQQFPSKIAALSEFTSGLPLTIGTRSAVHLYDPRDRIRHSPETGEHLDPMSTYPEIASKENNFSLLTSSNFDRFASLHESGPTAIQHLFENGSSTSNDIVISGRFPSLLIYDRRTFPKVKTTLYSGAQLCGLASLPYAYSAVDSEIMRRGELPFDLAIEAKSRPGHTLVACGEYKGRGSLEIYGLSEEDGVQSQTSTFKNRVSAASAKVLSIANHGARLVMSDAEGGIHWLERDGQTRVRRWNINPFETNGGQSGGIFGGPSGGEAAFKVLPVSRDGNDICDDGVLVWTGERIGLIHFSHQPKFGGENGKAWDEIADNAEDAIKRREERVYGETMKRALERQADEVRWMSGLGLSG